MHRNNNAARGPRGKEPTSVPPGPGPDDETAPKHDDNHDHPQHEQLDEVDERELGGEG